MTPQAQQQSQLSEIVFASSCGNTFAIAEGNFCEQNWRILVRTIIQKGLDTALLVEAESEDRFTMHVLEKDGSISNFCGNGAKAVGSYLVRQGKMQSDLNKNYFIGKLDRYCIMSATENYACVYIADDHIWYKEGVVYVMGEPHRINFMTSDQSIIDGHPVNESFIEKVDTYNYDITTWERGVNDFTESCGSACIAAASLIADKELGGFLYFNCPGGTNRVEFQDGHYILSGTVEFF